MSNNALDTLNLLDAIRMHVQAAWPGLLKVYYGEPKTQSQLPYAVILPGPVHQDFEGEAASLGYVHRDNEFMIIGRFAQPTDPTVLVTLQQIAQANALIAELQSGPEFIWPANSANGNVDTPIGMYPLVTAVDFSTEAPVADQKYEVTMTFSTMTAAPHH